MKNTTDFPRLYAAAHKAGTEAATVHTPTPMIVGVGEGANFRQTYAPVTSGVCGFAWIAFAGNTAWGRWAKKRGHADKAYPKGLSIWVSGYGQSMERKEQYARAFAKVLQDAGIRAYAQSRMD